MAKNNCVKKEQQEYIKQVDRMKTFRVKFIILCFRNQLT